MNERGFKKTFLQPRQSGNAYNMGGFGPTGFPFFNRNSSGLQRFFDKNQRRMPMGKPNRER